MLTIFGIARSRAVRTLWMAEELGLAYRHEQISYQDGTNLTPDYLAINPNAQIPAIRDGALTLYESLAINLYLAKRNGGPLAPKNLDEDALMMQWALWAATEIEPHALQALFHTAMLPEAERQPELAKAALAKCAKPLRVLDAHLAAHGGFLIGDRFTAADLNSVCVVWYLRATPEALEPFAAIRAWKDEALARPAAMRAMALRGD